MSQSTTQPKKNGAEKKSILPSDPSRRFWVTTACAVGGVTGVATAVPFVGSFAPSARARAAGAPVEVDLTTIGPGEIRTDRKSTRLNSSHVAISYAVFCLKKKKTLQSNS